MVHALCIEPGKSPYPCQLCDDGDYLNHCISPDPCLTYTAAALKVDDNIAAIYCRNGYMFSLPCNRRVGNKIICGVFFIVRVKNGKLRSLMDADVVKYSLQYWDAESYTDDEVMESWMALS